MATNTNPFYTYSATAGSSKTLQKPQDGGDNNQWGNYINTDLDEIVAAVNALSDKIADANEKTLVDFTATGSAVNHIGITNAATGNGPTISTAGTDSNVDLNVTPKGTGDSVFTNKIKVDDVIEKTTDHGVEIEGVLVKDSIVKTDDIQEKTTDHGVEIDGVTLKDGSGTFTGTGGNTGITIEDDHATQGYVYSLYKGRKSSADQNYILGYNYNSDTFAIVKGTGVTGTDGLHIDNSGNLGIGTSSPDGALDVTSADFDTLYLNRTVAGSATILFRDSNNSGALIQSADGGGINFHTTLSGINTERMRIDSSGHLIVPNGVTLGTAAGTYNADNTVDDYEIGTWNPTITAQTGSGASFTKTNFNYTKIGRFVVCSGKITVSSSVGSSGGGIYVPLPFTASNNDSSGSGFEMKIVGYAVGCYGETPNSLRIAKYDGSTAISGGHTIRFSYNFYTA